MQDYIRISGLFIDGLSDCLPISQKAHHLK